MNSRKVLKAVQDAAGSAAHVLTYSYVPWSSLTFDGARHIITLRWAGDRGVADGEVAMSRLPEHDFIIPGILVADLEIARCDHWLLPAPQMVAEIQMLVLHEA